MAQSKSTKKFEKNHLKDTLKRRKEFSKIKQKQQIKTKRKERKAKDNELASDVEEEVQAKRAKKSEDANPFGDMSVDDFFQGGFDIPEQPKAKKSKDVPSKTGKRKRTEQTKNDEESAASSDESVEGNPVAPESGSEAEDDDEMGAHKSQLEELAKKDPEFYKYMKENDPELLDFAEDADLGELDELSGSEEETPKKKQKKDKKSKKQDSDAESETEGSSEVTKAMLKKWRTAITEQKSLRATKEVVLAFRAAAHLNEEDGKEYKYSISNPDAYHELLVLALNHVPEVVQHHLPIKEATGGKVRVPTETKKYRTMTPMLKSHATSVQHLLENLSDAATIRITLTSLLPLLPYILSFKKLVRDLGKMIVSIWADPANNEATRIAAFLVLRRLIVIGDAGIREAILKAVYQGLVKGSRNTTQHTLAGVNLMKNSGAELWGLDQSIGYTTGFTFIRQLAIHLRSSITNNAKESYKTVYNWQYVHSLDFWSRVVSSQCDALREAEAGRESPLRPLIYPIVQVTLGAMRLIPTAQYFPLRFQLIRSLLRISLSTGTYIPLAPALYEVLASAEMRKPPKPSTLKALDFAITIRAAKSYLRTRTYQDGVGEQVAELLSEFFILYAKSVAFPELSLPVLVLLKRWLKDVSNKATGNKNGKVNAAIGLVVQKLEANARWIEEKRTKVEFSPQDRAGVEGFLKDVEWEKSPLGAYLVGQRKSRDEKAKLVEEGRKEEESRKLEEREEKEKDRKEARFEGFEESADEDVMDVDDESDDE